MFCNYRKDFRTSYYLRRGYARSCQKLKLFSVHFNLRRQIVHTRAVVEILKRSCHTAFEFCGCRAVCPAAKEFVKSLYTVIIGVKFRLVVGTGKHIVILINMHGNGRAVKQKGIVLVVLLAQIEVENILRNLRIVHIHFKTDKAGIPSIEGVPTLTRGVMHHIISVMIKRIHRILEHSRTQKLI